MGIGASYSYTFNETGTFEYHCSPHPFMTGKVIVK
ncbi:plastocyanin/azurin family copper-binding protein [Dehalobacterium formicoaceticum]